MNFVILTDYYSPIVKSGSIIIGDLASELSQKGHTLNNYVPKLDSDLI